jgi:CRISPR/Cas system-associated endonuclease Cas1
VSGDDAATAALLEFLNATETEIASAERLIIQAKNISQEQTWNPHTIRRQQAQGEARPYEKSEDLENPDHRLLIENVNRHNGNITQHDYFVLFTNGTTVGRKKR